jgi:hypothetical protein
MTMCVMELVEPDWKQSVFKFDFEFLIFEYFCCYAVDTSAGSEVIDQPDSASQQENGRQTWKGENYNSTI